jgi:sulfite exporter TauE/SafE
MALPSCGNDVRHLAAGRLLYNAGRILTYMVLGLAAGGFGHGIALQGFQKELTLVTGVLIVLGVLFSRKLRRFSVPGMFGFTLSLKKRFFRYFKRGSLSASFMIGLLNGLLPCGLVYVALGGAAGTGHVVSGTAYMALFGLGTVPAMFFLGMTARLLSRRFSRLFRKASPLIALLIGFLLIYRAGVLTHKACHNADATEVCVPGRSR